jgi:fucose permease
MGLGSIVGFVIPSFFLNEEDEKNISEGRRKLNNYLIVQNSFATIVAILMIIVIRDKPPTPPSLSASKPEVAFEFSKEMKKLYDNKNYVLLCIYFALLYGSIQSIGAIISSLTSRYDYTAKDNSLFGGVFLTFGIIGSILSGIILDKFQKFKLTV